MKNILYFICVLIFCSLTPHSAAAELESPYISVLEDRGKDRFFAMINEGTHYRYIQYNTYYDQVFTISHVTDVGTIIPDVAAIDNFYRNYYFVSKKGKQMMFNAIGLDTGELLISSPIKHYLLAIDYDHETEMIFGLARISSMMNVAVKINPVTGELTTMANARNYYSLRPEVFFINKDTREFWVLAETRSRKHILSFRLGEGRFTEKRADFITAGTHKVYNFNTMISSHMLFASGTKDSIILAGHNDQLKFGFVIHLSADAKNVQQQISQLQEDLLKLTPAGILGFTLNLVSPRSVGNFEAYVRGLVLERKLKQEYGVIAIERDEFFATSPYNVFVTADGVVVQ